MIDHLRRLVLALAVFIVAAFFFSFIRSRIEGYGLMDLWRGKGPASEGFLMPVASRLSAGDVHVLTQLDDEYARLADVILPAVVSIDTKTVRRKSIPFPIVGLRAFQDYMAPGKGSGAIISHEGHVVTNYHVIEGASSVVITLSTNEKLNARVLEGSQECDIALLKIDSKRTGFQSCAHWAASLRRGESFWPQRHYYPRNHQRP